MQSTTKIEEEETKEEAKLPRWRKVAVTFKEVERKLPSGIEFIETSIKIDEGASSMEQLFEEGIQILRSSTSTSLIGFR